MSEHGPQFDAAVVVYEAARNERDRIIDHPDKGISLDEYKRRISDAQAQVQRAHKAMMAARAISILEARKVATAEAKARREAKESGCG